MLACLLDYAYAAAAADAAAGGVIVVVGGIVAVVIVVVVATAAAVVSIVVVVVLVVVLLGVGACDVNFQHCPGGGKRTKNNIAVCCWFVVCFVVNGIVV